MKSPLLLRTILFAISFGLAAIPYAQSETGAVVFQVSPARYGHVLRLWQEVPGVQQARSWEMGSAVLVVYQPPGGQPQQSLYVETRPTYDPLTGDFDPSSGDYWIEDVSDGSSVSPRNHTGLADAHFRSASGVSTIYLAIPEAYAGHAFTLQQPPGATLPVTNGDILGEHSLNQETGDQFSSYGYFEAWAAFDTEKSFYVVDHTTRKRWPGNLANLSLAAPFDYTGSSPVREVRIRVQDNDMGGMFSFHDDSGASSWARPRWEMWGLPGEETGGAFVRGTIGLGRWFTMMRAGDGKVSPPKICPNHLDADWRSIFDDIGPQGTHDWQPISVWVRDNLFSGTWAIHHEDGPIIGLSPGGSQVQSAWDEFGNPQSIGWFELTGSVDNALPWNVVNESTGANFGQSTLIDYGPWYSGMAAPGTVGLANVPLWRESHELWIVDDNDHAWRVSAESHTYSMIEYSDSSGITSQVWFFSVSSAGDPSGTPWRIEDRTVGDFSPYASGGVASFSEWVSPPSAMQFKISPTRWNHDLYLVQPFRPWSLLEKGSIQGMWTIDPNGATQFTNYGFFDGSAAFLQGSEWWLLDATNGDISPQQTGVDLFSWIASDSEMDSDSDGLPDWYESTIQTDPFSSDSDNDGIGDFDEVRLGLSPTSAIVWLSPGEGRLQVYTRLE